MFGERGQVPETGRLLDLDSMDLAHSPRKIASYGTTSTIKKRYDRGKSWDFIDSNGQFWEYTHDSVFHHVVSPSRFFKDSVVRDDPSLLVPAPRQLYLGCRVQPCVCEFRLRRIFFLNRKRRASFIFAFLTRTLHTLRFLISNQGRLPWLPCVVEV
jgi:hypothetical protein